MLDRLLFSAKESVYKACYPLTRRWLDFSGCRVALHPNDAGMQAMAEAIDLDEL